LGDGFFENKTCQFNGMIVLLLKLIVKILFYRNITNICKIINQKN